MRADSFVSVVFLFLFVAAQKLLLFLCAHFPMHDEGKQRANENDNAENGKLLDIMNDDGANDLRAHLEFKGERKRLAKVNDHVEGLFFQDAPKQARKRAAAE